MADERIQKFVESHSAAEQLLNEGKTKEARQKYLEVVEAYHAIQQSSLDGFHKELAYNQVTTLFKRVNETKARAKVPYNLIIAGALIMFFSILVVFNPNIVGLASFEDIIRQPVDLTFTSSGIEQITLRDRPLTLSASGTFKGDVKLFLKQDNKVELIFDSTKSPSENGKFIDVCEETCDVNIKSNFISLFAQIGEGGSLRVTEVAYKVKRSDNTAPIWKGKTRMFTASVGKTIKLDLLDYFEDPEKDPLVFLSTTAEGIEVEVKQNEVTILAKSKGRKQITFIASDLLELTKIPVTIEVK